MSVENYEAKLTKGYYRVRKAWEDEESQIGQYRLLVSAQKKADENPGYYVFSPAGIAIYPDDEAVIDDEETVAVPDKMEESTSDEQAETNDIEEKAVIAEEEIINEDALTEPTEDEIAEAKTVALAKDEYPNDGNTEPILYAKANTLLNIRKGNSLDADKVTVIKKGTIVEVLELCDNGWYRIKCEAAECGYAYVSNAIGTYFNTGASIYTVLPTDSLWKIAEEMLGSGTRYTDIKTANNLTSNVIRVGMQLLIP